MNPNNRIGELTNPPHLVRTKHPQTGSDIIRRATRTEILRGKGLCFLPVYFKMCNRWYLLTAKGIWNATDNFCRYKILTDGNGDTLGIGLF
jgi:hypothetical protein